jgi:hypothetical protein
MVSAGRRVGGAAVLLVSIALVYPLKGGIGIGNRHPR